MFSVLGSQLHFDHTPKQRRVVSICYGRLSVTIDLWNLFCIRPEIVGDGVVQGLIRFIYRIDAPTNLFPSIHCLVSWMCFIGIRGKSYIPKWYRIFSCLFAIAVFASTLFTKQHFVVAGVIFAEICYYIGRHTKFYRKVGRIFDNVNRKAFGGLYEE